VGGWPSSPQPCIPGVLRTLRRRPCRRSRFCNDLLQRQERLIHTAEVNHEPVGHDDLRLLAFANYGHYTSMQVRQRAVRGLDLHLDRLRSNATAMFGRAPSAGRLVAALQHAVTTAEPCSVRVTLFSRDLDAVSVNEPVEPEVLVTVTAPAEAQHTPFRALPVPYERETPQIKHLATYGLLRQVRAARLAGYDDALFVDRAGMLSEGSTWNLCLYDGERWLWPQADVLTGITMVLLRKAMQEGGVPTESRPIRASDLTGFTAAFATNSVSAARPLAAIGENAFPHGPSVQAFFEALHESSAWQPI